MPDLNEIERDVAAQRQSFAASFNALSAALDGENVKQHIAALAEQYGGDIGRQAWGAAKKNPAAFALMGAGLAMMLSGTGARPEAKPPESSTADPEEATWGMDEEDARADAKVNAQAATSPPDISPRAASLRARLNDGLEALPKAAQTRVLKARKAALAAQEKVESKTTRKSKTALHNQPLAIGAVGLGIGAVIGAFLAPTRREKEKLGEHRDALMAKAKATLQDELSAVQQRAHPPLNGARRSAQN